ncbi:transcription regulator protein BACH1b [Mastacembelus armatus]|uniref:Transcription regulator protein BACH1-like n=1 Tax=Mastacembelus armatus TaxID=205130 RepID=A0A3Q3LXX4_9TELE|nr:transcription regulator protein BACH1-like [Mastacembelus armatus]XP_026183694.1 transcription regulator protein BACH1-like [Mastacembelus armatus]
MSLMAMSASRVSQFTFESTVHSSHVLRSLDEQRHRDTLCDITVVVEGQSFRAHRAVLASCCEYFTTRISSLTQHGAIITLPEEVTVAGFEPLLKFAYTSKLLFGKDDVLDIRNSASILGFRDLDEACFDFLLPRFFSTSKNSAPFSRKTCCKKRCKRQISKEDCGIDSDDILLGDKEVKPVADSPSQQEVSSQCNKSVNSKSGSQNSTGTFTPVIEETNYFFKQCPKYRKFQLACGKESCLNNPASVIRNNCDLSCLPCSSSDKSKNETEFPGNFSSSLTRQNKGEADEPRRIHNKTTEDGMDRVEVHMVEKDERNGVEKETDMRMKEEMEQASPKSSFKAVALGPSMAVNTKSSGLILDHCPLRTLADDPTFKRSPGQDGFVIDFKEDKKTKDMDLLQPIFIHQNTEEQVQAEGKRAKNACQEGGKGGCTERVDREKSSEESKVAENLKLKGSDMGLSQPNVQDPDSGSLSDTDTGWVQTTSLEWIKHHGNLSSSSTSCPFFQELDQSKCLLKAAGLTECEAASQSGVSSLNSGEDGDSETETEGDSESYTRERARQVQLPFSVDLIVDLSRNDFQQLLKQQVFTREQLEFVHDMRRRSKNRLAAQRCRKRKLDCIYNLQCEINKLKTEREKLIMEKTQLSQMKVKTCHSFSALCHRVCSEANLQPEQLQVLAKYTSSDCPLSSFFPHIDALLSQSRLPVQPQTSHSAYSVGLDNYIVSDEASSSSGRDTGEGTGDDQHCL